MSCQLPIDCINEIFKYLEKDRITLHSCLLVNRLWCKIFVRILWGNLLYFRCEFRADFRYEVSLQILNTLLACLPKESKDLLQENGIFISTSKPPLFNYASFCKALTIKIIGKMIGYFLIDTRRPTLPTNFEFTLLLQEIMKMFMRQIPALKELDMIDYFEKSKFIYYSGASDCLIDLRILNCCSWYSYYSEFFCQLSQICCNITSLTIKLEESVSAELNDLISSQNCLKHLTLIRPYEATGWTTIIPSLMKHSNTLINVKIQINDLERYGGSLSFIAKFVNLQELVLSKTLSRFSDEFKEIQHVTFPQLRIFKIISGHLGDKELIEFLENNGNNLKELYIGYHYPYKSLNLSRFKLCPNLKSLSHLFMKGDLETLKVVFSSLQQLKSFRTLCGEDYYLKEKELFEVLAKHSPESFHELILGYAYGGQSDILPEELEEFFINWNNRTTKRSLSFIVLHEHSGITLASSKNMTIIEKYEKLGVIKFEIRRNLFLYLA